MIISVEVAHSVAANSEVSPMGERILTIGDVVAATTLCRSLVLSSISAGTFPKPLHLSARRVGVSEDGLPRFLVTAVRRLKG
jgi:predicted DNA-binding transcriptional regulator AlpA